MTQAEAVKLLSDMAVAIKSLMDETGAAVDEDAATGSAITFLAVTKTIAEAANMDYVELYNLASDTIDGLERIS